MRPHSIHGLVQDCSISSVLALEILQSWTKPLLYYLLNILWVNLKSKDTCQMFQCEDLDSLSDKIMMP